MAKCGSCKFFIGAGDYNLCCEKHSWLCYRDTEGCELYEYDSSKNGTEKSLNTSEHMYDNPPADAGGF